MIRAYIKERRIVLLLFAAFFAVTAAILWLYALPLEAVLYALILCAVLGGLIGVVDFREFKKRRKALSRLTDAILVDANALPEPRGVIEADYQALIRAMGRSLRQARDDFDARGLNMMDYYTLWVHQIKTPIAAMRLLLEAADAKNGGELAAELFKIEAYVSMVLSYMRLESDATDFVIRDCPIEPIVKRAVRKYARLFILSRVKLTVHPIALSALTDEKWLSFAIEQVLSNAVKYTRAGEVSIYVDGGALVIEDTGIGIRKEDLPRVFERGYTGIGGRTDRQSTGIGLYLTKRILGMLNHRIALEARPGGGTRAIIDLSREEVKYDEYV